MLATDPQPPKWPLKVIRLIVRPEYLEEIEGDLLEEYLYHHEHFSSKRANFLYTREIFKMVRPNLIKGIYNNQKLTQMGMLFNYINVALRNIKKHRAYSAIKVGSFSLGIAVSLLISLFILTELQIDRDLEDKSTYRVIYKSERPERPYRSVSVPPILAPSLEKDYPEIKQAGRLLLFDGFGDAGGNLFRPSEDRTSIFEERFGYADPSILSMLDFELIHGDLETALREPRSLIISESKAKKYYPNENPVGKIVFINEEKDAEYVIHGVYKDLNNSHLHDIDFFFTLTGKEFWEGEQISWCCYNYVTLLEFKKDVQVADFENKLKSIHDQYFVTYEEGEDPKYADLIRQYNTLELQHVSEIYLSSHGIYDFMPLGDMRIVRTFIGIAIFILLLACANFINLTTANSAQRAKEIGLRKTVGAGKGDITRQFLVETLVITFISVIIGTLLASLFISPFSELVGKHIVFPSADPLFYSILLGFTVVICLLSGGYPSLYLARIRTTSVLTSNQKAKTGYKSILRNGLVIFQFTISMILIAGTLVVVKQMNYILEEDLGYDKEQVLMIHGTAAMGDERMITFKQQLESLASVKVGTFSNSMPVDGTHRNGNMFWEAGKRNVEQGIAGQFWSADDNYFEVLNMEFVKGRAFSNDLASDSTSVVINEAMAEQLRLEDPLNSWVENWRKWRVVGVVKNFNYENLTEDIRPLLICRRKYADMLTVKLASTDMKATLADIEGVWEDFNPNQRIRMEFLEQRFKAMYDYVEQTKTIFQTFAIFGLIVACLGLFGLSVFTVEQRSKEMSIRKVLGASVSSILTLLTIDYMKLILLALTIGIPITLYFAIEWLSDFSYRVEHYWDVFVFGGILLVLIALLVVGFHSLRSALRNPIVGLRNE